MVVFCSALALASTGVPAPFVVQKNLNPTVIEADIASFTPDTVTLDGEVLPVTWVNLNNTNLVSGAIAEKELRLLLPGGELQSGLRVTYVSTPKFSVGDRVLLIATEDTPGKLRLTSFTNSVFYQHKTDDSVYAADRTKRPITQVSCDEHVVQFREPDLEVAGDEPTRTVRLPGSFTAADWNRIGMNWVRFVADVSDCFGGS